MSYSDSLEMARRKGMLQSLQQQDAAIEKVIVFSKFVVTYFLQQEEANPGWCKANIEGPLYFVRRRVNPKYQLVVKNQCNTNDLIDNLHPDWEIDCQKNYVFYKVDGEKRIRGLWFHEDSERVKLETALEKTLNEMVAGQSVREPEVHHGEGSVERGTVEEGNLQNLYAQFGLAKPPDVSGVEQQTGTIRDESVTVSSQTLRSVFHSLADNESFITVIMQKLKDHEVRR